MRTGLQKLMASLQATGQGQIALLAADNVGWPTGLTDFTIPEWHPGTAADFLVQLSVATRMIEALSSTKMTLHHNLGVVYGVYGTLDVSTRFNAVSTVSANHVGASSVERKAAFSTWAAASTALEASAPQQSQDSFWSTSALSMVHQGNTGNHPFLSVTSDNIGSVAQTLANNGYDTDQLNDIDNYLSAGFTMIVPFYPEPPPIQLSNYEYRVGSAGLIAYRSDASAFSIALKADGTTKGTSAAAGLDPYQAVLNTAQRNEYSLRSKDSYSVDIDAGAIRLAPPPDLSVGTDDFPRSLSFQRIWTSTESELLSCQVSYSRTTPVADCKSMQRGSAQAVLGNGWSHNLQISAEWANSGLEGLGATSALRATKSIAHLYSMLDIYRSSTFSRRLTAVLVAHEMTTIFMKNSVLIYQADSVLQFVKLPDGTYDPPFEDPSATISITGSPESPIFVVENGAVLHDYDSVTLTVTTGRGDTLKFSWNYQDEYVLTPALIATPTFSISEWTAADGTRADFHYTEYYNRYTNSLFILSGVSNNLGHSINIENGWWDDSAYDSGYVHYIVGVSDNFGRTVTFSREDCDNFSVLQQIYNADGNSDYDYQFGNTPFTAEECDGKVVVTGADQTVTTYSYAADIDSPDPAGAVTPTLKLRKWYSPSDSVNPYLTLRYDQVMHLASVVEAGIRATEIFSARVSDERLTRGESKDAAGHSYTTYSDQWGNVLNEIDQSGRVTRHSYDQARRRTETIFPEGNGIEYTYDVRSNPLSTTQFPKPGSLLNKVGTSTTYYEGEDIRICTTPATCNKPATTTDAKGNVTSYTFNSFGQLSRLTGPSVSGGAPRTDYCYTGYSPGNVLTSFLTGKVERVSSSQNRVTRYAYDGTNKFALSTVSLDPSGSYLWLDNNCTPSTKSAGVNLVWTFSTDSVGNVEMVDGPRTDVADATQIYYDGMRRITRIDAPENFTTRYAYTKDGQLYKTRQAKVADPTDSDPTNPWPPSDDLNESQWRTEKRSYLPTGELETLTDAALDVTSYQYDPVGRLRYETDPDGRQMKYVCDARGKVLEIWKGWGSEEPGMPFRYVAYTYSDNGQRTTVKDANGNTTAYAYDGLDRHSFAAFPSPLDGSRCALAANGESAPTCDSAKKQAYEAYSYLNSSGALCQGTGDQVCSKRTRKGDTVTYGYDALNRGTTKTASGLPTVSTSYNLASDITGISHPALGGYAAHSIAYGYDDAGRKLTRNLPRQADILKVEPLASW